MFRRKKKARRLIVFGLSLMMLMFTGIVAHAASNEQYDFYFELEAGGDKEQTSVLAKHNYYPDASVTFIICENISQYPLWYRLRYANTGAGASGLYGVYGTGTQYIEYKDGYGAYGTGYYLRIQTDSKSQYGAMVKGYWLP